MMSWLASTMPVSCWMLFAARRAGPRVAPLIARLARGRVNLRILSNLADRRRAWSRCRIPFASLVTREHDGEHVARGIVEAYQFAAIDPYRAATHNKGVMNGIDAVAIATGNDWRGIEAGAHAFAARGGRYTSLTEWRIDDGHLIGTIELPMAVGVVGGSTRVHPTIQVLRKVMGSLTAIELAMLMASVGLAQNLGALKALATEGICSSSAPPCAHEGTAAGVPSSRCSSSAPPCHPGRSLATPQKAPKWCVTKPCTQTAEGGVPGFIHNLIYGGGGMVPELAS